MKLLTRFELVVKSENELRALLREAFNELVRSEPNTCQRTNALVSIEILKNELNSRFEQH